MRILLYSILLLPLVYSQSIDEIKSRGLNKDQLIGIAKESGLTDQQIESEIKSKGFDLKSTNKMNTQIELDENDNKNKLLEENIDDEDEILNEKININEEQSLNYFGYKIFRGNPEAFQSSNFGAVDPSYNIGPGDQIIVMLWGESQFRQEFTIDREGYVFIPEVGQVFVNGLNLEDLEKKFFQIFSKVYSTLKPTIGKPTTFMDISLGNLRPLRIIVLGEVAQPGAYSVNPSASLSSSLYYFNGPTTFGSLRNIRLIRKGDIVGSIDFYDYLLSGNIPNDLRLQGDDVVFIPKRGKTATIRGEINRPGIYELKDGEGLSKLLEISGGISTYGYARRAQINRVLPFQDRLSYGMDRMIIDVDIYSVINNTKDITLEDGDEVEIFPIEELEKNYVLINSSSVTRPGKYQLTQGMKISDLINQADGVLNNVYKNVGHIKRINTDLTYELISFNLNSILQGKSDYDYELKYMDEVIIYNENEIKNVLSNIQIFGSVKNPGIFSLSHNENLSDLILKTGGFIVGEDNVKISVARKNSYSDFPTLYYFPINSSKKYVDIDDLSDPKNEINNFKLQSNDIINIYSDPNSKLSDKVIISGEIKYPGIYPIISKNEKVSDIILRAGGFLDSAYPLASTFVRDNKSVKISFNKIMKNPNSEENFIVMDNDQINISSKTNIVTIAGSVNQPGNYKFYKNYNLRDYINIAGGLSPEAEKEQIWVSYPNGNSFRMKKYFPSPKVFDGSVITVGKEEDREPIDKTELAKELASIVSDFLQIALTFAILLNSSNSG